MRGLEALYLVIAAALVAVAVFAQWPNSATMFVPAAVCVFVVEIERDSIFRRSVIWVLKEKNKKNSKLQPQLHSWSLLQEAFQNYGLSAEKTLASLSAYLGKLSMSPSGFPSKPAVGDHYVDLTAGDVYVYGVVAGKEAWVLKFKAGTAEAGIWVEAARGAAIAQGLDETGRPVPPRKISAPVVGFRCWLLDYAIKQQGWDVTGKKRPLLIHDPKLMSVNRNFGPWEPGINRAECKNGGDHPAPEHGHHCGYWLKNSIYGAQGHLGIGRILGAAQGWGRVIKHEDGWRCEYVSVLALCSPVANKDLSTLIEMAKTNWALVEAAKALAMKFDVPLLEPADFVREYGNVPMEQ